jgi:carboxyl-terminal processing protease
VKSRRLYILVAFVAGALLAWSVKPGATVSLSETVARLSGASSQADFSLLPTVWDAIHRDFVNANLNDQDLLDGALAGMVGGLEDPYSAYLPPDEALAFDRELTGRIEGIGAEIGVKDGTIVVIAPLPETPAAAAGVKAGDRVLAIDDQDTAGLSLDTAVQRIRGPAGTTVTLVLQSGTAEPRTVAITRASIRVVPVATRSEPGGEGQEKILIITLRSFTADAATDLARAVSGRLSPAPSGVVLDVRGNPGGYLEAAVGVAGEFLTTGTVVIEQGRDGRQQRHDVDGKPLMPDLPLVVLVDHGSASAAEIVAGALQDAGRATLFGTRTFGKGTVQTLSDLPNGGDLKLTVARWLTPRGRSISPDGIAPDTEVQEQDGRDAALDAALEFLRRG